MEREFKTNIHDKVIEKEDLQIQFDKHKKAYKLLSNEFECEKMRIED